MRWAPGGGGCVRSCRSARHWRGDGTGSQSPAPAPASANQRGRRFAAALVDGLAACDEPDTAG